MCEHIIKVQNIALTRLLDKFININTYGSALNNQSLIREGGILRDQAGKLLVTYTPSLGNGTNNNAEIGAAIFGMTWNLN